MFSLFKNKIAKKNHKILKILKGGGQIRGMAKLGWATLTIHVQNAYNKFFYFYLV